MQSERFILHINTLFEPFVRMNSQRQGVLDQWKEDIRGILIGKKEGVSVRSLNTLLEEALGLPFPYMKLGYGSFEEYLVTIPDIIEVRKLIGGGDNRPYLFVRPGCIPHAMQNVRQNVLNQKSAGKKGKGKIIPVYKNTYSCSIHELSRLRPYSLPSSNPFQPIQFTQFRLNGNPGPHSPYRPPTPSASRFYVPPFTRIPPRLGPPPGFSNFAPSKQNPLMKHNPPIKHYPPSKPMSSLFNNNGSDNNFIGIAPLSGAPANTASTRTYNGIVGKENSTKVSIPNHTVPSGSQGTSYKSDLARFNTDHSQVFARQTMSHYDEPDATPRASSPAMSCGIPESHSQIRSSKRTFIPPPPPPESDSDSDDGGDFDYVGVSRDKKIMHFAELKTMLSFNKTIKNDKAQPKVPKPREVEQENIPRSSDLQAKMKAMSQNIPVEKPKPAEIKSGNGYLNGKTIPIDESLLREPIKAGDFIRIIRGNLDGTFWVGPLNYDELKRKLDTTLALRIREIPGHTRNTFSLNKMLLCIKKSGLVQRAVAKYERETDDTFIHYIDTGLSELHNDYTQRNYLLDSIDPRLCKILPLAKKVKLGNIEFPKDPDFNFSDFIAYANTFNIRLKMTDGVDDIIVVRPQGFDRFHRLLRTYLKTRNFNE